MIEVLWLLAVIHLYFMSRGRALMRNQCHVALSGKNYWLKTTGKIN